MQIKGCKITRLKNGFAVKNTVFEQKSNAPIYAYYLRIVLINGGKIHYVKDFEEAVDMIFKNENRTDKTGMQRQWLVCGWHKNEDKYLHVASGMYAINNLNE